MGKVYNKKKDSGQLREKLHDAQIEIERSRQEYSDFYDFAPAGYFTLTADGTILNANLKATDMLGHKRAYLLKQPLSKFIIPEDIDKYNMKCREIVETRQQQECELRIKRKNGDIFWAYVQCRPVLDQAGEVTRIRSVLTDITERKRAEVDLQKAYNDLESSEQVLRSVMETATSAIISADKTGNIIFWNHTAEKIFGYSVEEILHKPLTTIMPERYRELHLKGFNRLVETGKSRIKDSGIELYGLKKDGTEFPLELFLSKWHADSNIFFTAIINDTTERKQVEEELKCLLKTLDLKNRELRDIVYTASHDLKSPLVNIQGFSGELLADCDQLLELLDRHTVSEDRRDQTELLIKESIPTALGFITASTKKISGLLDGLLRVSRIGAVEIKIEFLDMNSIVREVLKVVEYQLKEYNITVTVDSLPGCMGDFNMLDHIFTNLISNAIKYRDPAKKGRIKISASVKDGMSIYCVEDNGIGIVPDYQKKIFEIFHRLNPHDIAGGEGLGLTIVKRIMDRLGGQVWLESEPGKGSKFFISLSNAA